MSVTYVNGATVTSGASIVTTLTVNYAPIPNNMVLLGISLSGAATNLVCTDSNGNILNLANPLFGNGALFYGFAAPGITSYTITWTTGRKASIGVVEYSGCRGVGNTGNILQTGLSSNFSLTTSTGYYYSVIVGLISSAVSNLTFTQTSGTIEQQITGGAGNANNVVLMDNTAAAPGSSVVLSGTISTAAACFEQEVELYPGQPITEASSSDDQWLGGDEY